MLLMWLTPYHPKASSSDKAIVYPVSGLDSRAALLPSEMTTQAGSLSDDSGDGWNGVPPPQPRDHARETPGYTLWRVAFQNALKKLDKAGLTTEAQELRRWFHKYHAHEATRCLAGEGPAAAVSPLFNAREVRRRISPPPATGFQRFYGYKVVLPWNRAVYYYRGDPISPDTPFLLHDRGVSDSGSPARLMDGLENLFREAGVTDEVTRRVLLRVSAREGGFDAINTWDTGYVSVGFIQFTTGERAAGHSLVRVLQRMKDAQARKPANEFKRFFSDHGIDVRQGELFVRDPLTGEVKTSQDAVKLIIEDKRLVAIFQDAGRKSRAFQVAQIREAFRSYYLADKFFRIPVTEVSVQVGEEPVRKRYAYGDEAVRVASEAQSAVSVADVSAATASGESAPGEDAPQTLPVKRVVRRLPDLVARYSDVLYSERGRVALTDRAVQRGVKNASATFLAVLAEVAEGLPPNLKMIRGRESQIVAGVKNRIDVVSSTADPRMAAANQ